MHVRTKLIEIMIIIEDMMKRSEEHNNACMHELAEEEDVCNELN